ncbi:MAG: thymidine phosphorylase [Fimbriimonadales bacterium]|nr:thymidine phosphorylase [Fimbriimonadales bacterium]
MQTKPAYAGYSADEGRLGLLRNGFSRLVKQRLSVYALRHSPLFGYTACVIPLLIAQKRDGGQLTREQIEHIVMGYVRGVVPDYQVAAWLMACYLNGLSDAETLALTEIMARSGEMIDLSELDAPTLDKHSTGGVGDKTSLVLVPLLAAGGVALAKMSGRGLGFTGGTVDKLESIPGYRTELTAQEMLAQVKRIGCCLAGQSASLAPADKYLYALRDATATVESIPLIAASIMSKKLAGGARHILLDVKVGAGAFMTTRERANMLAQLLVRIGEGAGRRTQAILTDMSQPLGYTVGNALEVREAIETMHPNGRAHPRFRELVLHLAAQAFVLCRLTLDMPSGRAQAERLLQSGDALAKFQQMVEAQGGDPRVVENPALLPHAPIVRDVYAPQAGYVQQVHPRQVALACLQLGAGRQRKEDVIDHAVGVEVLKCVGEPVQAGEPVFRIHARTEAGLSQAQATLMDALSVADTPVQAVEVILSR